MKDKANNIKVLIIICLSLVVFIMTSIACNAEEWNRRGKGEIFALVQQMTGDTTTGLGVKMELDDTMVGGIGAGYNFHDYLNLNTAIFFGSTDLIVNGGALKSDADLLGMDFNLDYNILKSRFTPLITAGIGFINFNGDFSGNDFNETDFSYNLGAGFRWDITDHFLIKGIYKATWTEMKDTDDSIMFHGVSLSIGYLF